MTRFLFVGRLDNQKNPLMLLKVAHNIINQFPDTIFTIVGDGEKYQECKKYICDSKLESKIKLVGWQKNVYPFYKESDIFIATSIYEAFGLIFLEAGYNKLPTVSTNVEGIPEVVLHGETGLLSDANDIETMTNNAIYLIKNPIIRKEMGERAFKYVTSKFSSELMVRKYKDLYENKIHTNTI